MLKGIICPADKKISSLPEFRKCQNCSSPCMPLPIIYSLISDKKFEKGIYHVTELLKPVRITYLQRKYDYNVKLNGLVNMMVGTAVHALFAEQRNKVENFIFEPDTNFEVEIFPGVKLSGTPDLYDVKNKIIYDYKVVKKYEVSKMLEGQGLDAYTYQLNIYKTYKFPEAKKLTLVAVVKDFVANDEFVSDVKSSIMQISIKIIEPKNVKKFVENKIKYLDDVVNSREPVPMCSKEENWGERRCLSYCDVVELCKKESENGNN